MAEQPPGFPPSFLPSWGENPELLFFPLTIPDPRKTRGKPLYTFLEG